jgi:hypothetical protein
MGGRLAPVCHFRQRDKFSGQFVLQERSLRRFSAYSRLSRTAFSTRSLLALITEHMCHYETSIGVVSKTEFLEQPSSAFGVFNNPAASGA